MNLNDLETFLHVAEEGTFSQAADRLGVPTSTVSRRVQRLEEELGIALLVRSSRSIALSDDGRALAARTAPAIRELNRIERGLGDTVDVPRGKLRVTTSIDFGSSEFFTHLVADYAKRFEEVDIEVDVTNRVVDLLEEGFDVAFRVHVAPLPDRDDLVVRQLGEVVLQLFASKAYLASGAPSNYEELADHPLLAHATSHRGAWPAEPAIVANDYSPLVSMIAAGAGIGALPLFVAEPYVERGSLVPLDFSYDVAPGKLSLVWLRSRHLAPRVRAFIDLAVSQAASASW